MRRRSSVFTSLNFASSRLRIVCRNTVNRPLLPLGTHTSVLSKLMEAFSAFEAESTTANPKYISLQMLALWGGRSDQTRSAVSSLMGANCTANELN